MPSNRKRLQNEYRRSIDAQVERQVRERLRIFREALSNLRKTPAEIERLVSELEARLRRKTGDRW